jgi:hypothetical protein
MLGTTTSNFSDVDIHAVAVTRSAASGVVVKSPGGKTRRRNNNEQQWISRTGADRSSASGEDELHDEDFDEIVDYIDDEVQDDEPVVQSSRLSMGFLLAGMSSRKKSSQKNVKTAATKDHPCIVELRRAVNVPQMFKGARGNASNGAVITETGTMEETNDNPEDTGGTNPFVTMKVVPSRNGSEQRSKGVERRWPYKSNTLFPVSKTISSFSTLYLDLCVLPR